MKIESNHEILEKHGAAAIIEALGPFVSEQRQARISHVIAGRLQSIQLAIETPSDINNALAAVRSSEAFGVSSIHLIAPEGDAGCARLITQGAVYWVDILFHDSLEDFLTVIRADNILLAGGTVTATQSVSDIPVTQPICLIVGNEQRGLSPAAQAALDIEYTIPMVGMSESFNLSVSAAISLYETTNRKRQLLKQQSDLSTKQQTTLRAKYYLNSVNQRLIDGLFK